MAVIADVAGGGAEGADAVGGAAGAEDGRRHSRATPCNRPVRQVPRVPALGWRRRKDERFGLVGFGDGRNSHDAHDRHDRHGPLLASQLPCAGFLHALALSGSNRRANSPSRCAEAPSVIFSTALRSVSAPADLLRLADLASLAAFTRSMLAVCKCPASPWAACALRSRGDSTLAGCWLLCSGVLVPSNHWSQPPGMAGRIAPLSLANAEWMMSPSFPASRVCARAVAVVIALSANPG